METFFISDTHFGHKSALSFCRPQFKTVEEMDEHMIERWNSVVGRHDRVYHLGDFAWSVKAACEIRPRLNGTIRLMLGNHDDAVALMKARLFQKIELFRVFKENRFMVSHMPIMPDQMRHVDVNVHGHTHQDGSPYKNGISVCVEKVGFTPVHIDHLTTEAKHLEWKIASDLV